MTMESGKNGFRYIQEGLNYSNYIISRFKRAEEAFKKQEETIAALKAELTVYKYKEKEQKKNEEVKRKSSIAVNHHKDKVKTVRFNTTEVDTSKAATINKAATSKADTTTKAATIKATTAKAVITKPDTAKIDTAEAIHRLQQESKIQQQRMHELARENDKIKKENQELKNKLYNKQKILPIRSTLIDTKNQTQIPRPAAKKRSSPFDEIESRFSSSGIVKRKPIISLLSKKRKPNQ